MKITPVTKPFLQFRNLLHKVGPDFFDSLESLRSAEKYRRMIRDKGYLVPLPAFVKRSILKRFFLDHQCKTLVETGTQYGDTPWQFRSELEEIFTIELSPMLADLARKRFQGLSHIHVVEGDSGVQIREVIPKLRSKTLFWLDGHYSAGLTAQGSSDCPIFGELESIFTLAKVPFVILVDDARCFGRDRDYPSLEEVRNFVEKLDPRYEVEQSNDIISISLRA